MKATAISLICASLIAGINLSAGAAEQPTRRQLIQAIDQQLASDDPAVFRQGIAAIDAALATDKFMAQEGLNSAWLKRLASLNRHEEVADLAQRGFLVWPVNDFTIMPLLRYRIRALIALGRTQEALADARSGFNVASMQRTSEAMALVWECLVAAHPNDRELLLRFREEQWRGIEALGHRAIEPLGAAPQSPDVPMTPSPDPQSTIENRKSKIENVMLSIRIDPAPYDRALLDFRESGEELNCRANLLLMAGRIDEARELFERQYQAAPAARLAGPTENLARCMKAEDGNVARANRFISSVRPKDR
jgi:tetratricopeptide (TPR) repeat protein